MRFQVGDHVKAHTPSAIEGDDVLLERYPNPRTAIFEIAEVIEDSDDQNVRIANRPEWLSASWWTKA